MKYILNEKQIDLLNEVTRVGGSFSWEPLKRFFQFCENEIKSKDQEKLFRKFFERLNYDTSKIEKGEIIDFFTDLAFDFKPKLPKMFFTPDVKSGFAYFLAKNFWGLKDGFDEIEYIDLKDNEGLKYYFFDPAFKVFVGEMALTESPNFKGNSWKVNTTVIEKELRNQRYGIKMYLSVISGIDYLQSDRTLYTGAYRMWTKGLPQYCNVWYVTQTNKPKFKKIKENTKVLPDEVDFFVASVSHNTIMKY